MSHGPRYRVKPRRRREGLTDYRIRLELLKSRKIRLVVRKSLKYTNLQFVEYKEIGDNILISANSKELSKKYNWKHSTSSIPAAYLTGIIAGKKALDKGIKECVLDIGRYSPVKGSKVFAALKGVVDAGVNCPFNDDRVPDDERLSGKHINKDIDNDLKKIKTNILGGK